MKKNRLIIILATVLCMTSCRGGKSGGNDTEKAATADFPYPEVPSMIQPQEEVLQHVSTHFWNRFFENPEKYNNRGQIDAAFANYCSLLADVPLETMRRAQDSMLTKAERYQAANPESGMLTMILDIADHYLNDPNSPYRNEEIYLPVVDRILESPLTDEAAKERATFLQPRLQLNRLGEVAADFTYTLKNGRTGTLHNVKADRILLFFSNPGCTNCKEIIELLSSSDEVTAMISSGSLKVLNIYPDANLSEWYNYMSHYPETWINGFDAENILHKDVIYYIKAIPSLYLLDSDKRVLAKDAPPEVIMQMLLNDNGR